MSKTLKQQVVEQLDQAGLRVNELSVEIAQNQEKLRALSQQMQDVQQQTALLINEKKGEEITLQRLQGLAGEE